MIRAGHWQMKGVTLVFVFDGKGAPAMTATNEARRARQIPAREQLNPEGISAKVWRQKMASAVNIDWRLVSKVIDDLREAGFVYVRAIRGGRAAGAHVQGRDRGRGVDVGTFVLANFKFPQILHAHTLPTRIGGFAS